MTAVYVAARFDTREQLLRDVVPSLKAAGHSVTSRWLLAEPDEPVLDQTDLTANLSAGVVPGTECLDDIKRAEAVVVFTGAPSSTGGITSSSGTPWRSTCLLWWSGHRSTSFTLYPPSCGTPRWPSS